MALEAQALPSGNIPKVPHASFKRNAFANLAAYLVPVAIAFFLSPFLIRTLGDSRYGVWAIIGELSGYYGLLDLGIRGTVGYYVARHFADGDWEHLQQIVNLAFWVLSAAAVVVMAIGFSIAWHIPSLFRIGDTNPSEVRLAAAIMVASVALNLPLSLNGAFLNGLRRLDLLVAPELTLRCVSTALMFLSLRAGYGLVAVCAIQAAGSISASLLQYITVRRVGIRIRLWPAHWRKTILKDVFSVAGANVIFSSAVTIVNQLQPILIGGFLSTALVTYFVIPRQLVLYYHLMIASITLALTTSFTYHYSSKNMEELTRLYMKASRLTGSLALFLGVALIIFGHYFLRLWVGEKYVSGPFFSRSDVVLVTLVAGTLLRTTQNISGQLLLATRHLRYFTILRVSEAVATVALTFALISRFGLLGVCLGTAIPMFVSHIFLYTHTLSTFGFDRWGFWQTVISPVLITALVPAALGAVAVFILPPFSWPLLLSECAIVSATYALTYWRIGLSASERIGFASQLTALRARWS